MRHGRALRKLGRDTEHRLAMLRNLSTALFDKERITTTLHRAKEVRPFAERLITLARRDTLHSRRQAARSIADKAVLKKLFDTLGPRFSQRPGGYSRILRLGWRPGDGAEVAMLELIGSEPTFKKEDKKGRKAKKKEAAEAAAEPAGKAAAAATGDDTKAETEAKPAPKSRGGTAPSKSRGRKKPAP